MMLKHCRFQILVAACCLAVVGCAPTAQPLPSPVGRVVPDLVDPSVFSPAFMWGAGSSAHQCEGNDADSDWWAWEHAGNVKTGEVSGLAADHWNRFEEDFDHLQSINLNTFRLSLSWARLFPRPDMAEPDAAAVAHYDAVFDSLARRGIRPMVTMHHFVMPAWLSDQDRWATGEAVHDFVQLSTFAALRWGKYVDWWITVNEAEVFVFHGWLRGIFPPGKTDLVRCVLVMANLMKAHALAARAIREYDAVDADGDGLAAQVGIAQLAVPYEPESQLDPVEAVLAAVFETFGNTFWLVANQTGILDLRFPFVSELFEEFPPLKNSIDFIGVNYYSRQIVRFDFMGGFRFNPPPGAIVSDLGTEVYPRGLYESLQLLSQFKLPMIITEIGIADADDSRRYAHLVSHLSEMSRFMRDRPDAPVLGCVYWALTDNFEWENGFAPRFGLVAVDYATQQRTVRDSAKRYAELLVTLRKLSPTP